MRDPNLSPDIAYMSGPEALPRRNGELAFDAPWQGRAFALAIALSNRPGVGWDRFRTKLAAAIAERPGSGYWDCWVDALDRLAHELNDAGQTHEGGRGPRTGPRR